MANGSEQPHLVSLVLQSKKALLHGEQLCSRARTLASTSAEVAGDVLALDAKLRFMTNAVLEQVKLAASVAKSIELKRTGLETQTKEWDEARAQHTEALDSVLESLGAQVVPPDFHSNSTDSSLFGSHDGSDDEHHDTGGPFSDPRPGRSPTETLRNVLVNGVSKQRTARRQDRSKWKTLRDFINERDVEDLLDSLEADRNILDDILSKTSDYPEQLANTIAAIRATLPTDWTIPLLNEIFNAKERALVEMAQHLTSLAEHYDQMAGTLRDSEGGGIFTEEDFQAMNRDTEELPAIIADLDGNVQAIQSSLEQLVTAKQQAEVHVTTLRGTLADLDELGEIMAEMLDRQDAAQGEVSQQLTEMYTSLGSVEEFCHRFTAYRTSFDQLLIEIARRRRYKEAAEKIIEGMMSQLSALTEEERSHRVAFNDEHGEHLPADVCLSIQNPPTRWEIITWNREPLEELPMVDNDLLLEADSRLAAAAGNARAMSTSQSL
ncbi:hypothetical protein QCA50_005908 [Cerrena zonata]|uniref:Autophagy-related protein 17 n=1 Tax=Cerrena zonata TaxID=2478898 RepID=A0AAW0GBJ6_9APHY